MRRQKDAPYSPRPPPRQHKKKSVGPSDRRIPFLAPSGRCETGRVGDPREGPRFRQHRLTPAVAASMSRQTFRVASDEIPIAPGGESPFSGTPACGAVRGCWRGCHPAGSHRLIEQRVSFLRTASKRRVIILPPNLNATATQARYTTKSKKLEPVMKRTTRYYCTECDWSASIEDHSRDELFQATLKHFSETKHTIKSNVATGKRFTTADSRFNYKERILQ